MYIFGVKRASDKKGFPSTIQIMRDIQKFFFERLDILPR